MIPRLPDNFSIEDLGYDFWHFSREAKRIEIFEAARDAKDQGLYESAITLGLIGLILHGSSTVADIGVFPVRVFFRGLLAFKEWEKCRHLPPLPDFSDVTIDDFKEGDTETDL